MKPEIYAVKEGYKILLTTAPIGDPKLRYRREVERFASRGEISVIGHIVLDEQQKQLGISPEESDAIEEEVLKPYRERERNCSFMSKHLWRQLGGRVFWEMSLAMS